MIGLTDKEISECLPSIWIGVGDETRKPVVEEEHRNIAKAQLKKLVCLLRAEVVWDEDTGINLFPPKTWQALLREIE